MKKAICLLVMLALGMGFFGCGKNPEPETTTEPEFVMHASDGTFQVGYARRDITPRASTPLSGYGNNERRMSTEILRRCYATAVAMRDADGKPILLMSLDTQGMYAGLRQLTTLLSAQLGIPKEQIICSATHTHAAPDVQSSMPVIDSYLNEIFLPQTVAAAKAAFIDLQTAQLSIGSIETEGLNFVRHYTYTDEAGNAQYFGDSFGTSTQEGDVRPVRDPDTTLYVMKIQREGRKDIIFTNWRAHPHFESRVNTTNVSSDYVGAVREYLEMSIDCEFVFYQGAAGNINPLSSILAKRHTTDMSQYASEMTNFILQCLENNMEPLPTGPIQTRQTMLEGKVNHDTDIYYYDATAVMAVWQATNDQKQAIAAGGASGIRSSYQANAIRSRKDMGETEDIELNAFAIGDHFAIVSAPNELFDSLSVMTEVGSPYEWTMCFGYANNGLGYMPDAATWEYTSYETDVTRFVKGTGEQIVDCYLSMLNEIYGE